MCISIKRFFFLDNWPFAALISFLARFYSVVCFPIRCLAAKAHSHIFPYDLIATENVWAVIYEYDYFCSGN